MKFQHLKLEKERERERESTFGTVGQWEQYWERKLFEWLIWVWEWVILKVSKWVSEFKRAECLRVQISGFKWSKTCFWNSVLEGSLIKTLNRNRVLETQVCKASFINSISTWKTLSMSLYEKTPKTSIKKSSFRNSRC